MVPRRKRSPGAAAGVAAADAAVRASKAGKTAMASRTVKPWKPGSRNHHHSQPKAIKTLMIRSLAVAASLILAVSNSSQAQTTASSTDRYAPVPFGIGERATYRVVLGIVGDRGQATLDVVDLDTVQGRPAYELRF